MPAPVDLFGRALTVFTGSADQRGMQLRPDAQPAAAGRGRKKGQRRTPLLRPRTLVRVIIWGLFVMLAFASSSVISQLRDINAFPDIKMPLDPAGPDAWIRLVQVRQWLSGGNFFDHSVIHTNAPAGGPSRPIGRAPMDTLVAFFLFPDAFRPCNEHTPAAGGDMAARKPEPFDRRAAGHCGWQAFPACAGPRLARQYCCWSASTNTQPPGDVDHHGLLTGAVVRRAGAVAGAAAGRGGGALSMGALLGLMVWTSPESLVLAAAVLRAAGD